MNLLSSSSMFGTVWEASSSFPLPCALKDKYIIDKASTRLGLILVNGLAPIEDWVGPYYAENHEGVAILTPLFFQKHTRWHFSLGCC